MRTGDDWPCSWWWGASQRGDDISLARAEGGTKGRRRFQHGRRRLRCSWRPWGGATAAAANKGEKETVSSFDYRERFLIWRKKKRNFGLRPRNFCVTLWFSAVHLGLCVFILFLHFGSCPPQILYVLCSCFWTCLFCLLGICTELFLAYLFCLLHLNIHCRCLVLIAHHAACCIIVNFVFYFGFLFYFILNIYLKLLFFNKIIKF